MRKIDLKGIWSFCLDGEKKGLSENYFQKAFDDEIILPATVSTAQKTRPSDEINTGYLTDPYSFEGFTWYSKTVDLDDTDGKEYFLVIERTRVSHLWVDGVYVGSNNSLCTPHRYYITPYAKKEIKLTIMVDNTSYPVKGGHMTSPDTQTNWNGITGGIYIEESNKAYLSGIKLYPDAQKKLVRIKAVLNGDEKCALSVFAFDDKSEFKKTEYFLLKGENDFTYFLDDNAECWSEYNPHLYRLRLSLKGETGTFLDEYELSFGLRDFKAAGKYFEINGKRTFLRGKHDGLVFPLTGHAPTDVESWLKVLGKAKEYGINHYRFHTCCPPDAAFEAADILGIYMEPELPFWGTVTEEGDENHDEKAQQYLIDEGFRILDEFGNHPSFVMMSLGNELWGSKNRLNTILGLYRKYDSRHLYTQGSNNFQFVPCILDNEDFFCGVRFSRERLFRGSYAMCDAPQGHIQTAAPNSNHNYDSFIRPSSVSDGETESGDITIQYGTGTKTVKADALQEIVPHVPVVSHEIGQYAMFPDFSEIEKYTGVLKARNFEAFRKTMAEKGMLHLADRFFKSSGRFAAECYKAEIETAIRSNELAGFQILDLQDFPGQGTALVGILNAFMENKGVISAEEWREFCSQTVLLAEFSQFIFQTGEEVSIPVKLAHFGCDKISAPQLRLKISDGKEEFVCEENKLTGEYGSGVHTLTEFKVKMPSFVIPKKLFVEVIILNSDIKNSYNIWVYPEISKDESCSEIIVAKDVNTALNALENGKNVLLYPENLNDKNSIEGTYCTDFWCYPMFRTISESMGKPVPIGTHGLLVENTHPVFNAFPSECYSTPQWYDIVSNSRAAILDKSGIEPVVFDIDNFERSHKLGIIFETRAGKGKLLVCTCNLDSLKDSLPAKWLRHSIIKYMRSDDFNPKYEASFEELIEIFK